MEITATALSGMSAAQDRFERVARRTAQPAEDSVDLSAEAVQMMESRNAFQANASVARAGDDMERTALDILA